MKYPKEKAKNFRQGFKGYQTKFMG